MRPSPPRLLLWLALLLTPGLAAANTEVRIGIPLGPTVSASETMNWRDSRRQRGEGKELELARFQPPGEIDGDGPAVSGGRRFPLPARIVAVNGRPHAVVELGMERYLAGVLPVEMHPEWPTEALKAQAVVARSFAYRRLAGARDRYGDRVDVVAGTADQEFEWRSIPPSSVVDAIDETEDEILRTRSGRPARAFYHSCCGGHTADASEVWGQSVPGITPVEDAKCTACPNYFWSIAVPPAELGGVLDLGPVSLLRVLRRGLSERVVRLRVSDGDASRELSGLDLRRALGADRLRSTLFRVRTAQTPQGPRWVFQGSGSGHGAGLCQWGAKARAEAGHNYREILAVYFPQLVLDEVD